MRICFLCRGLSARGGVARVISILLTGMAKDPQHKLYVCSFYDEKAAETYPIPEGVTLTSLYPKRTTMRKGLLTGAAGKLRRLIRTEEIDFVIAGGAVYFPLAVLAVRGTTCRAFCWEHTAPRATTDYKFQDLARSFGARRSAANILLTPEAQATYKERFPKADNRVIPNPLDPQLQERPVQYDRESRKIISVGRLHPAKDYPRLLRLAAEILPAHPDWEWDIYGDGPLRAELEAMRDALGLETKVHFCGTVMDLYARYERYAFLVMTSEHEGSPMAILEAMARGLPVAAFDVPTGPAELIREDAGFLIPADSDGKMRDAIEALMADADLREKLSEGAVRRAAGYGIREILAQWNALMEEKLGTDQRA